MLRQKFGLKSYFEMQNFCFTAVGIDPISVERTLKYPLWTLTTTASMTLVCVGMAIYAVKHITSVDEVTKALGPIFQCSLSVFKTILYVYNRKRMVQLVRTLMMWNLKATTEEKEILIVENLKDARFCVIYYNMVRASGVTAMTAPLLVGLVSYVRLGEYLLEAPLIASYPINHYASTFNYIIIYIINFFGIWHTLYASVSVDTLFSWISNNIIAQFKILHLRLQLLVQQYNDSDVPMESITHIVQFHCRAVDIANELDQTFSMIVFIKFAISCIQLCFIFYQFSLGGPVPDMLFRGCFLLAIALQLFMYCSCGQRVADESAAFTDRIYDTFHWENLSVQVQKALLLPMIRSRRYCKITGIFFVLDLSLFLWVFRTAGSYITMLWAVAEK